MDDKKMDTSILSSEITFSLFCNVLYKLKIIKTNKQRFLNSVISMVLDYGHSIEKIQPILEGDDSTGKSQAKRIFEGSKSSIESYLNGAVSINIIDMISEINRLENAFKEYLVNNEFGIDFHEAYSSLRAMVLEDKNFLNEIPETIKGEFINTSSETKFLAYLLYFIVMLFYGKSLKHAVATPIPIKEYDGLHLSATDFGIEKDFKENIVFYLFEETILTNFYGWSNSRFKNNVGINSLLRINFIKIEDDTAREGHIVIKDLFSNLGYFPPSRIAQNVLQDDEKSLIEESIVIPLYKRSLTEVPIIQRGFVYRSMVKDMLMGEVLSELFKGEKVSLFVGVFDSVEKILQTIKVIKDDYQSKVMCTYIEYPNESSYKGIHFKDKCNDEHSATNGRMCFSDCIDVYSHFYYDLFLGKIYRQFLKKENETEKSFPVVFKVSESGFLTSSHIVWCLLEC